jgi:hypothetical protein
VNSGANSFAVMGEVAVTDGGSGKIQAILTFDANGQLTDVAETRTVEAGIRPLGP